MAAAKARSTCESCSSVAPDLQPEDAAGVLQFRRCGIELRAGRLQVVLLHAEDDFIQAVFVEDIENGPGHNDRFRSHAHSVACLLDLVRKLAFRLPHGHAHEWVGFRSRYYGRLRPRDGQRFLCPSNDLTDQQDDVGSNIAGAMGFLNGRRKLAIRLGAFRSRSRCQSR